MPFTDAFRKVSVKNSILTAECRKSDHKTWISSSINLDDFLGNNDGKFVLGGKGFSHSAQDIVLVDGSSISAKLKNSSGKYVDAKIDLGTHLSSMNGIIAAHGVEKSDVLFATGKEKALEASADAYKAEMSRSSSSFEQSQSTVTVSHSASHSESKTFKSSSFRQFSQQFLLEETCSDFYLEGTIFHCDYHHENGRVTHVTFDLDLCIGIVDGRLVWDASGFSKATKIKFSLDKLWLTVTFWISGVSHEISARLDLRSRLRIQNGAIIVVETNKKLSMMLSEVPWMKFKVIAEPDLSVFSKHPVVQQTMTRIAESTVEHVTTEMHKMLTLAMETAIVAITASAMKHVSSQMHHTVLDAVGYATASPSATESEYLHIGAAAGLYGMSYGAGGAYAGGYAGGAYSGGGYGATEIANSGIHYNGGAIGTAHANGGHVSAAVLDRSFSENSIISTSSSEAHAESRSMNSSSASIATQQASVGAAAAIIHG